MAEVEDELDEEEEVIQHCVEPKEENKDVSKYIEVIALVEL